jgi:hypothetical protein
MLWFWKYFSSKIFENRRKFWSKYWPPVFLVSHFSRQESVSRGSDETLSSPRSPEGMCHQGLRIENFEKISEMSKQVLKTSKKYWKRRKNIENVKKILKTSKKYWKRRKKYWKRRKNIENVEKISEMSKKVLKTSKKYWKRRKSIENFKKILKMSKKNWKCRKITNAGAATFCKMLFWWPSQSHGQRLHKTWERHVRLSHHNQGERRGEHSLQSFPYVRV